MAERLYDIKEIAKRTKESLAEKFPTLTFKVTFDRRGGSTMNVRLMKGDFNPFTNPDTKSLPINWRWIKDNDSLTEKAKNVLSEVINISQKYNWDNSDPMTDYFDVNYYLNMSIGLPDEKPYEYIPSKSKSTRTTSSSSSTTSSSTTTSSPSGEVLMSCSGWTIYKKTLDDGRIVYNARINKDTTPNKSDWSLIKGEIYTQTGFKWGKFGAFEKWGQIASEAYVLKILCDILGKYYTAGTTTVPIPAPAPVPSPAISLSKIAENVIEIEYVIWDKLGIKSGGQLRDDESLQEKYAFEVKYEIIPFLEKYSLTKTQKLDLSVILAEENAHNLNNSLSLSGYFGDEEKREAVLNYEYYGTGYLNPKYYIASNTTVPIPAPAPTTEEKNRLFMVGDIFYNVNYPNIKYFISSINSNDEVGFANIISPKSESIYGSVEEVNKLFREGTWKKDGRYDYPEETSKAKSKEDIQKAIKGLQYLADRGNENAKKAIKGLQYLLNK
jgi:hypothetical protein